MVDEIRNLAIGYISDENVLWLKRYLKCTLMLESVGYKSDFDYDIDRLCTYDIKGVAKNVVSTDSYLDTINGILLLADMVVEQNLDESNDDIALYCRKDLAQRVGSYAGDMGIASLARQLEVLCIRGRLNNDEMEWLSDRYDYEIVGNNTVYVFSVNMGYRFSKAVSRVEFTRFGSAMRVHMGEFIYYVDLMLPQFNRYGVVKTYNCTLSELKKLFLLD